MHVKSLGYRTDLIFPRFDGEIIDRGEYLVIRTTTNPDYYWGNFLLFAQPPQGGDLSRWRELFAVEIGTPPDIKHQVFGWDTTDGEVGVIQPFLEAGFRLDRSVVLTNQEPRSAASLSGLVSIRPLRTEDDWHQAVENQVLCRAAEFEENEYRRFQRKQMERFRKMAGNGLGDWYGAFIEQRLVADLGIFHQDGLGRYQSVETHPDFRRRGIAGGLILGAGGLAMKDYKLQTLVIVADEDSGAARLYKSLGFQLTERQAGLELWPHIGLETNSSG